jgi:hypothetical protein
MGDARPHALGRGCASTGGAAISKPDRLDDLGDAYLTGAVIHVDSYDDPNEHRHPHLGAYGGYVTHSHHYRGIPHSHLLAHCGPSDADIHPGKGDVDSDPNTPDAA